jgi:hypothetical protein
LSLREKVGSDGSRHESFLIEIYQIYSSSVI